MLLLIIFIVALTLIINVGIYRQIFFEEFPDENTSPENLSVIIAVKNEEANLPELFKALGFQQYAMKKVEILMINDGSNDNSVPIIKDYQNNALQIKLFNNERGQGKKAAVMTGIEKAENEFLIITDADCIPESKWLNDITLKMKEGFDLVFGLAPLVMSDKAISKYVCFDNLRSQLLMLSAAKFGIPYSATARSLAFRKSCFNRVGGFNEHINMMSGDDDLLLQSFVKNKLRVTGLITEKSRVYSKTVSSLKEFIRQKSRHVSTSNHYNLSSKLFLSLWHLMNIIAAASLFITPFFPLLGLVAFNKLVCDIILIRFKQQYFGYSFSVIEIIFFQILYELLVPVIYFKATFSRVIWR